MGKIKIGIVTLYDDNNYGNKLQAYALQRVFEKKSVVVEQLIDDEKTFTIKVKKFLKKLLNKKKNVLNKERYGCFLEFNKNIKYAKVFKGALKTKMKKNIKFDKYIVGSDQVWNPGKKGIKGKYLLDFTKSSEKYSYAASFGKSDIPSKFFKKYSKELSKFKRISVREKHGIDIIKKLDIKKEIAHTLDPTLLLTADEWKNIEKQPKSINKEEKYILLYFLGNMSLEVKEKIESYSQRNGLKIINLMDKESSVYETGPSEFVYLIHNADLIISDSFHACVFSFIFKKPFIVLNRQQEGFNNMNSRIESFLTMFKLEKAMYNGEIFDNSNMYDSSVDKKFELEKNNSLSFIDNILKEEK